MPCDQPPLYRNHSRTLFILVLAVSGSSLCPWTWGAVVHLSLSFQPKRAGICAWRFSGSWMCVRAVSFSSYIGEPTFVPECALASSLARLRSDALWRLKETDCANNVFYGSRGVREFCTLDNEFIHSQAGSLPLCCLQCGCSTCCSVNWLSQETPCSGLFSEIKSICLQSINNSCIKLCSCLDSFQKMLDCLYKQYSFYFARYAISRRIPSFDNFV